MIDTRHLRSLTAVLALLAACFASPAQESRPRQAFAPADASDLPHTVPVTRAGGFAIGTVRRTLARGSSANEQLTVALVASRRPARSERVTVVPLEPGLATTQMVIRSVDVYENPLNGTRAADDLLPDYWQLEFESNFNLTVLASSGEAARTGTSSVDVAVLFPASPRARALDVTTLSTSDLPGGHPMSSLKVAIDADGDRVPDFVVFDTGRLLTYERVEDEWRLIDARES